MDKLEKVKQLNPNTTKVFYTMITLDTPLTRTGAIDKTNSIVHAILNCVHKGYYMNHDRYKYMYQDAMDDITEEISPNGCPRKSPSSRLQNVVKHFDRRLSALYKNIIDKNMDDKAVKQLLDNEDNYKVYSILIENFPVHKLLHGLYNKKYHDENEANHDIFNHIQKLVYDSLKDLKNSSKVEKLLKQFMLLIKKALIVNEDDTQQTSLSIDETHKDILEKVFNVNIFFISAQDRCPKFDKSTTYHKSRNTVFILTYNNNKDYEDIGLKLEGNAIQRNFKHNDPLQRIFYTLFYNKGKFKTDYKTIYDNMNEDIKTRYEL